MRQRVRLNMTSHKKPKFGKIDALQSIDWDFRRRVFGNCKIDNDPEQKRSGLDFQVVFQVFLFLQKTLYLLFENEREGGLRKKFHSLFILQWTRVRCSVWTINIFFKKWEHLVLEIGSFCECECKISYLGKNSFFEEFYSLYFNSTITQWK